MAQSQKGPTRAKLLKRIDRLVEANQQLEERLARVTANDNERRPGEHWYELVERFDAKTISRLKIEGGGRAWVMGRLGQLTVVEVTEDADPEEIGVWLKSKGVEALIVQQGIRFLRIRAADPATEAKLDAFPKAGEEPREADSATGS